MLNILLISAVTLVLGAAVFKLIRDRKKSAGSCGGCSGCPAAEKCRGTRPSHR